MTKKLTITEKDAIRESLRIYIKRYSSQNVAANSINGTSAATISAIRRGKYENIADDMFRNIASQICTLALNGWQLCKTIPSEDIKLAMRDAQDYSNVRWLIGNAGCGKTTTANLYASENRNTFIIQCSEDMKKRDFIKEIARQVGISVDGNSTRDTLDLIIGVLVLMDKPLLIFDEADKLNDNILYYIITMYNRMEDRAGILLMSTSYMKKRMGRGVELKKRGYEEIYSRIGGKFYNVESSTGSDAYMVCSANGITDDKIIARVIKESEESGFDFRIIKKAVHKAKRLAAVQTEVK